MRQVLCIAALLTVGTPAPRLRLDHTWVAVHQDKGAKPADAIREAMRVSAALNLPVHYFGSDPWPRRRDFMIVISPEDTERSVLARAGY